MALEAFETEGMVAGRDYGGNDGKLADGTEKVIVGLVGVQQGREVEQFPDFAGADGVSQRFPSRYFFDRPLVGRSSCWVADDTISWVLNDGLSFLLGPG